MSDTLPDLIDIGLNLTHESFDVDRAAVLERAQAAGVGRMILTGATQEGSHQAAELARAHPGRLLPRQVSIPTMPRGEYGHSSSAQVLACLPRGSGRRRVRLDWFRDFSPRPVQEKVFIEQLEMAVENRLPLFLHQRDASDAFLSILRDYRPRITRAVVHCFTDDRATLFGLLDLDCHIGITGWICDERRGRHLKELVPSIPSDRLMIETDAPYLMPRDLDPKPKTQRNEPMHLAHIAAVIARCVEKPLTQLPKKPLKSPKPFWSDVRPPS